ESLERGLRVREPGVLLRPLHEPLVVLPRLVLLAGLGPEPRPLVEGVPVLRLHLEYPGEVGDRSRAIAEQDPRLAALLEGDREVRGDLERARDVVVRALRVARVEPGDPESEPCLALARVDRDGALSGLDRAVEAAALVLGHGEVHEDLHVL